MEGAFLIHCSSKKFGDNQSVLNVINVVSGQKHTELYVLAWFIFNFDIYLEKLFKKLYKV